VEVGRSFSANGNNDSTGNASGFERPMLSLLLIVALLGTAASFVAAQTVGAFWVNFATSLLLAAGLAWRLWQLSKRADSPDGNGTSA
jgi:protein-S-isoprenylcysteine O-methyltransferase Ste14